MNTVHQAAADRGITRLCHLTPYINLLQIARGEGLRSVSQLHADQRAAFDQQDLRRLDGHPDHISCSVEYPNVWYLRSRRQSATPLQLLFPDWVCLLIHPAYLWAPGTLYCHRNAAAGGGAFIATGLSGFLAMYDDPVEGANGLVYRQKKPASCPTDDQAEVLVERNIPLQHANQIVVADVSQARRIHAGLTVTGTPAARFAWIIAPQLFSTSLSGLLRRGDVPRESFWRL